MSDASRASRSGRPVTSEYVFGRNHPQHAALANSCVDHVSAAYPEWVGRIRSQALRNLCAFAVALFKPPRDVLLLEAAGCLIPSLPRIRKRTVVLMIHSDQVLHALENAAPWKRALGRFMLGRVDVFLSSSRMMEDTTRRMFPERRHAIFRLFINASRWEGRYDPESLLCLYVGRADRFKNQALLADAIETLRDRSGKPFRLRIIGNALPDYLPALRPEKRPWLEVTGWRPDPASALEPAAFYVNAASWEPAGINILEAMAMGIPPVVSDRCGYASVVTKLAPDLVVPPEHDALLKALERLDSLTSQEKIRLSRRARKIAESWTQDRAERRFARLWKTYSARSRRTLHAKRDEIRGQGRK